VEEYFLLSLFESLKNSLSVCWPGVHLLDDEGWGLVSRSVLVTTSSPGDPPCPPPDTAPEQLLLWFSTLWLAGLMARVKHWLRVPEEEEILGTDLDNTELLWLLLLMLMWPLTYLRGPSLSLSTWSRVSRRS